MILTFVIMLLAVALDQISKYFVVSNMALYDSISVVPGFFRFTYIENKGAAFGMLADHRWVFLVISTIAIVAFVFYIVKYRPKDLLLRISAAFIVGGGIGNMIDRCLRGSVVDFIDVEFIEFYIFNVADMFVCVGCGLMMLYLLLAEVKEQRKKKAEGKEEENE